DLGTIVLYLLSRRSSSEDRETATLMCFLQGPMSCISTVWTSLEGCGSVLSSTAEPVGLSVACPSGLVSSVMELLPGSQESRAGQEKANPCGLLLRGLLG